MGYYKELDIMIQDFQERICLLEATVKEIANDQLETIKLLGKQERDWLDRQSDEVFDSLKKNLKNLDK
jgi:hypothetical protein